MAVEMDRRLKAARELAGLKSQGALARKAKFGESKIKRIEEGNRELQDFEIPAIAKACGLPEEFFTADLAKLGAGAPALQEAAERNEVLAELAAVRVAQEEQRSLLETVIRNQETGS